MTHPDELIALGAAQTFEDYVTAWEKLKGLQARLVDAERAARKHIVGAAFPQALSADCAEGVHHFKMADGRKLTYTHKVSRKLDEALLPTIREEFNALNDRPCVFDDLVRMKPDLVLAEYKKVDKATPAGALLARLVTEKAAETPDLKVT